MKLKLFILLLILFNINILEANTISKAYGNTSLYVFDNNFPIWQEDRTVNIYKGNKLYNLLINRPDVKNVLFDFPTSKNIVLKSFDYKNLIINKQQLLSFNIGKYIMTYEKETSKKNSGLLISDNPILVDMDGEIKEYKFEDLIFDTKSIPFDPKNLTKSKIGLNISSNQKGTIKFAYLYELDKVEYKKYWKINIQNNNMAELSQKLIIKNNINIPIYNINVFYIKNKQPDSQKSKSENQFHSLLKERESLQMAPINLLLNNSNIIKKMSKLTINGLSNVSISLSNEKFQIRSIYSMDFDLLYNNNIIKITKDISLKNKYNIGSKKISVFQNNNYLGKYKVKNHNLLLNTKNNNFKIHFDIIRDKNKNLTYRLKIRNNSNQNQILKINSKLAIVVEGNGEEITNNSIFIEKKEEKIINITVPEKR